MNDFVFVKTIDGLGQSIVIRVADAIHRGFDARSCVFLGGLHRAERAIAGRVSGDRGREAHWPNIDPDKALPWVANLALLGETRRGELAARLKGAFGDAGGGMSATQSRDSEG